jgi:hypothetical protein
VYSVERIVIKEKGKAGEQGTRITGGGDQDSRKSESVVDLNIQYSP